MNTNLPIKLWIPQIKLLKFILLFCALLGFGMEEVMAKSEASQPSGVLYFSNGASIEKLDLRTGKQQEIVPWQDRDGRYESNSVFPVYSSKEKKMYFFRSYVWPVKRQLVTFDLENQKEEKTEQLDHYIKALSLLMNNGSLTSGGGDLLILRGEARNKGLSG